MANPLAGFSIRFGARLCIAFLAVSVIVVLAITLPRSSSPPSNLQQADAPETNDEPPDPPAAAGAEVTPQPSELAPSEEWYPTPSADFVPESMPPEDDGLVPSLAPEPSVPAATVVLLPDVSTPVGDEELFGDETGEPSLGPSEEAFYSPEGSAEELFPSPGGDVSYDHVAHAVPGREYSVVDLDGDGVEIVMLDASRSHSHYYDSGPPPKLAEIVSWEWFEVDTGKLLASSSTPFLPFPLGVTKLGLRVEDDFGNKHQETTTVTVSPSTREGAYCYFYNEVGADGFSITIQDNVVNGLKPVFGEELPGIDFPNTQAFPKIVSGSGFQTRCVFYINVTKAQTAPFSVEHHGPMRMLREIPGGHDVVMEDVNWGKKVTSTDYKLPEGLQALQIIYLRRNETPGLLKLLEAPQPILHNLATQLPLIYSLEPANSTLPGGGMLKVKGTGLWGDPYVYFGTDINVKPDGELSTTEQLFVEVPPMKMSSIVDVTIGNKVGGSNALKFKYSEDSLPPIKFNETRLLQNGTTFNLKLITNLQYGPDHKLYLASLDSFVYSLSISKDLEVSDLCQSESLGYLRTVIGLAFDPAVQEPILYASSSIFYWGTSGLKDDFLWANGQISVLKPNHGGSCLGIVGKPLISGLPVSNHDHGVNNLLFDDDGLLHFQVGASTNAGVAAKNIGGIEESPLSAASLYADIYAPGFDGNVKYDSPDPGTCNQISGDVKVYAPGWRNSFDLTMHSNGIIYATDNGANAEFGNRSTSCTESEMISAFHTDDKLGKVIKGKYAGHANRNRGRKDARQCIWRNPLEAATDFYQPPIATFESSTDGLIEYTADLFDGQLKGNLLASKYSTNDPNNNGKLFRIQLDGNGDLRGDVDVMWEASGLSIAMTPWGDIMMPMLYDNEIMVLRPLTEKVKAGRLISVLPFRGPAGGGNEVLVTVTSGGLNGVALFAGKACTKVRERTETSFKCDVPDGAGGTAVKVGIKIGAVTEESSGGADYRYMRV